MIKYIFALICFALMYRIESTGKLKHAWGVFTSLMTYIILFFIDEMKELIR